MADERHHILMLPFMAQGHFNRFLSLAQLIDRRQPGRFAITLLSTPINVRNLRASLPPDSTLLLRELPFCSADHGLPPDCESTDSILKQDIVRLCCATESLRPHFERFVADFARREGPPFLCIIADGCFGWTAEVARDADVFHCTFTCGAYGTAAFSSLWLHLPHLGTDAEEFHIPGFPDNYRLQRSQLSHNLRVADGKDAFSTLFRRQLLLCRQSNAMLCNTVEELETAGIRILEETTSLRVWPVGPLLPMDGGPPTVRQVKKHGVTTAACTQWLGLHPPSSVLYISFGSENTLTASQMMALAAGLASSGTPFIWVIRPPIVSALQVSSDAVGWLPEGFEEETRRTSQGLLVRDWAPQLEILSHPSTGAFLSHCGWNSVLESLTRGVPLIGWPLSAEQFYNAKMLVEELGVCVELARGLDEDVASGEVERVIRLVMGHKEGEEMRKKAADVSGLLRAAVAEKGDAMGSSLRAIDDFIWTALEYDARRRK